MHNFDQTISTLSDISQSELHHFGIEGIPFPSVPELREFVDICRSILFPGYYGKNVVTGGLQYHIGVGVEHLYEKISKQFMAGIAFAQGDDFVEREVVRDAAKRRAKRFVEALPESMWKAAVYKKSKRIRAITNQCGYLRGIFCSRWRS